MSGKVETTVKQSPLLRRALACLVFAVSLAGYAGAIDRRPFYTRGESREALVVLAMYTQQDYVLPKRNDEVIPSKPPLFHWMATAAANFFGGLDELNIRLPSALCASFALAVVFAFVAESAGLFAAVTTIIMLGTSLEWCRNAVSARVDMCFTAWLTLSTLALYSNVKRWLEEQPLSVFWFLTAAVACALAVLAKGPAGLALPWLVAGGYALAANRQPIRKFLHRLPLLPCALTFLVSVLIAGSWYYLAFRQHGSAFLEVHLLKENISRILEVDGESRGHRRALFSSPLFLLFICLPWSMLFPVLCVYLWRRRKCLRSQLEPEMLLCLVWLSVYLLVITFSRSKREVYMLPAAPAAAWMIAYLCLRWKNAALEYSRSRRLSASGLGLLAMLLAMFACVLCFVANAGIHSYIEALASRSHAAKDALDLISLVAGSAGVAAAAAVAALCFTLSCALTWKGRLTAVPASLAAGVVVMLIGVDQWIMPTFSEFRTPREFMSQVASIVSPEEEIFRYKLDLFSATYYAKRTIPKVKNLEELGDRDEVFLLVRIDNLDEVRALRPHGEVVCESATFAADGQGRLALVKLSREVASRTS